MKLDSNLTPALFMACLLTSAMPVAKADLASPETFLVGFQHALPEKAKRGGKYLDADVVGGDEALGFLVVSTSDAPGFQARAHAQSDVRYVQREQTASPDFTPNDPSYSTQWAYAHIGGPSAWDVTTGSASVLVAVLDTGVDHAHPDLAGARLLQGWNFMAGTSDTSDSCGHGTHVAGILGATMNNGIGIAGTAQVTILPIKVMDKDPTTGSCYGPFSAVASGIRYATDQGARVISMSLGCVGCFDQATADAMSYATQHGALVIASAGNNGPCTDCVSFPASDANAMAVACSDQYDAQCTFSSSGAQVEITAPGRNIYSTVPGGSYMSMSGTSMSAPFVAGAAGLAFSVNSALSGSQVRQLIDSTARDLGAAGVDPAFGYGLLNMSALVRAAGSATAAPAPAPAPYVDQPPVATFSYSASGLTVSANAGGSYDPDGTIVSYAWAWGDGATASGVTASHTYAASGTFTVTLTVTDNASVATSTTRSVSVTAPAPAPAPTMHVGAITSAAQVTKSSTKLTWSVPVLSSAGAAVGGASVTATLTTPGGAVSLNGVTGSNGVAALSFTQKRASGSYTLCVQSVSLSGWTYDSTANAMTCQTLTV